MSRRDNTFVYRTSSVNRPATAAAAAAAVAAAAESAITAATAASAAAAAAATAAAAAATAAAAAVRLHLLLADAAQRSVRTAGSSVPALRRASYENAWQNSKQTRDASIGDLDTR